MYGALTLNGTDLCNTDGYRVQLRGVSTHGLHWFPQYVNPETFGALRDDWGVNLIRLAMYTGEGGYCDGADRQQLENLIDAGVQSCLELGLYCIIDWHILSDGNPLQNMGAALDFFGRMSAKYADYDNVIYEICNEPNGCSWNDVKAYANEVIPVIRANAPYSIIIVGTTTWSQDVDTAAYDPVADPYNVMYAAHFYAATHGDWNRQKIVNALNAGAPVFISEFSTCDASGDGAIDYMSAGYWKDLITERNLSYAGWNLANKDEASSFFPASCGKLSGWTEEELSDTARWLRQLIQDGSENPPVVDRDEVSADELYKEAVLYLPGDLAEIRDEAFSGTNVRTVVIPEGVLSIGPKAFAECGNLRYVEIPETVISIAEDAFDGNEIVFVCGKGSAAAAFAAEHGIPVKGKK